MLHPVGYTSEYEYPVKFLVSRQQVNTQYILTGKERNNKLH